MTGDNNGRWAGSYDWPDNQESYVDNARATILAIRSHASLLLWCGGNELNPADLSPPPYIASNLQNLVTMLDPKRFYIPSSMAPQSADPSQYDPQYALACQDGPYGILFPSQFYNERNPGEPLYNNSFISYQPEVGSVSTPVLRTLERFLSSENLLPGSVPHYLASDQDVPPTWQYHKYLPYTTGTYDHLYAYSADYQGSANSNSDIRNLTAKEFAMRAQIIQLQQYQALYEGFSLYQWRNYSAVLLWKSQSPWPALRGALYDYYLDYTGGFWGVRNALIMYSAGQCTGVPSVGCADSLGMYSAAGLHAMMNPTTRQVSVINRHAVDSHEDVMVRVTYSDLHGKELLTMLVPIGVVPAHGAITSPLVVPWPADTDPNTVVLYFLEFANKDTVSTGKVLLPNLYWLTSPTNGDQHDYSQLGALQLEIPAKVQVSVRVPWTSSTGGLQQIAESELLKLGLAEEHLVAARQPILSADFAAGDGGASAGFSVLEVSCPEDSPAVAFMLQLSLLKSDATDEDPRVLPTYFSLNYITLRPGDSVLVVVAAVVDAAPGTQVLEIEGWNVPAMNVTI